MIVQGWCWRDPNSEHADGPFATREAAIVNAREEREPGARVAVSVLRWPDPGEFARSVIDVDDLLERMDQAAFDDGRYTGGDQLFDAPADAEAALKVVVGQWAVRYVSAASWSTGVDEETVTLE